MKCANCWEEVGKNFPDTIYNRWLQLFDYFQHELLEEEITEATCEEMIDCLMAIKSYLPSEKE